MTAGAFGPALSYAAALEMTLPQIHNRARQDRIARGLPPDPEPEITPAEAREWVRKVMRHE